jgi:REP element-mobilizing transposase RayT
MSFKQKKSYKPNTFYHIYNRGNRKNRIFLDTEDYQKFISLMQTVPTINKLNSTIYCYCLMPNHFHLLIDSGSQPGEITTFMHRFMTSYAMYFNKRHDYVGRLFQSPYKAKIVDNLNHFNKIVNYISENPVKAGLVKNAEDYKWCEYTKF